MSEMVYAVVRCPNGHLSITFLNAEQHRCPICGTRFLLRPKRSFSRIVFDSPDVRDCRDYIILHSSRPEIVQASLSKVKEVYEKTLDYFVKLKGEKA
jgi:DNA-directed RNA polymerase subunit RPC12/RpoP